MITANRRLHWPVVFARCAGCVGSGAFSDLPETAAPDDGDDLLERSVPAAAVLQHRCEELCPRYLQHTRDS